MEPQPTDPIWMHIMWFVAELLKIFLAAFLGAACAFAYERRKRLDEAREKRIVSLRDAQFALQSRINSFLVIATQYLKKHEKNPNRWVDLPPVLNVTNAPPIPLAELSFLLDNIDPNLLGEITVAWNRFDTVCRVITHRNRMHDEFQRLFEQGAISQHFQVQLTHFTDALYERLPDAVTYMHKIHKRIGAVIDKHFPGVNALRFAEDAERMIKDLQTSGSIVE